MHNLLAAHWTDPVGRFRKGIPSDPLRILVSGCIAGELCGIDGTDYGMGGSLQAILRLPSVTAITFCPETYAMGIPRGMPDIHGGDGFDVLDGTARVLDEQGTDLTAKMIEGVEAMVQTAMSRRAELALLTDMSAACGSQVISDGCRLVEQRGYRVGVGVAAAALLRAGIPVVSQRDYRTLVLIGRHLESDFVIPEGWEGLSDHHESDWYRDAFGAGERGMTFTPAKD